MSLSVLLLEAVLELMSQPAHLLVLGLLLLLLHPGSPQRFSLLQLRFQPGFLSVYLLPVAAVQSVPGAAALLHYPL